MKLWYDDDGETMKQGITENGEEMWGMIIWRLTSRNNSIMFCNIIRQTMIKIEEGAARL